MDIELIKTTKEDYELVAEKFTYHSTIEEGYEYSFSSGGYIIAQKELETGQHFVSDIHLEECRKYKRIFF